MVGVNGIGMGHSVRQGALAAHLRSRGHRVEIVTNGPSLEYFREQGFTTWDSWMPKLAGTESRIPVGSTIAANLRHAPRGIRQYAHICDRLRARGIPEVFVSDYEPNSAWLAYALRRPLVSVDQQSKYRYLDLPRLDAYRPAVERQRLRLFMPRVERSFVCSFLPLNSPRSTVEFIPPILSRSIRGSTTTDSSLAIAYFSRYFDHGPQESGSALANVFRAMLRDRRLRIYTQPGDLATMQRFGGGNVEIRTFHRQEFLTDLIQSQAVFCNAGFNLIAEAFTLGKPCYLVPLPTYDQHWCARTVGSQGFGVGEASIDRRRVTAFLKRRTEYADRIEHELGEYLAEDPLKRVAEYIEALAAGRREFPAHMSDAFRVD